MNNLQRKEDYISHGSRGWKFKTGWLYLARALSSVKTWQKSRRAVWCVTIEKRGLRFTLLQPALAKLIQSHKKGLSLSLSISSGTRV
jgi:hypothetical protein